MKHDLPKPLKRVRARPLMLTMMVVALCACGDGAGPGVFVRLKAVTVDGQPLPITLPAPGSKQATIAEAFLLGTNWGSSCGVSVRLTTGPITAGSVPDCKLHPGDERKVSVALPDTRFPSGTHEYLFVP